jgi:hypothetical protein
MNQILDSIDTRDLATAIWLGVLLVWGLVKPAIREAMGGVIAAATAPAIATFLGLAIAYLVVVTATLQSAELWTLKQLKITVLWFVVAGVPALMSIPEISRNPELLRATVAKNFKLSLLLDFFVNLFKLPFLLELVFVPFMAFVGALLAVAQSKEEYLPVQKLLNGVLAVIGSMTLAFEIYKLLTSFDEIANADTLRDFALPVMYNISFILFLWVVSIYAAYDSVFARLRFVVKDGQLHAYTKRCLVLSFRTDISLLNKWFKNAWTRALTSRSEINESIADVSKPST